MWAFRLNRKSHRNTACSGEGSAVHPGRWNNSGIKMLYASEHLSLALLELWVNLPTAQLKKIEADYEVFPIEIVDDSIIHCVGVSFLPPDWRDSSQPTSTRALGTQWMQEKLYPVIGVPSAVVASEFNFLINPEMLPHLSIRIDPHKQLFVDDRLLRTLK